VLNGQSEFLNFPNPSLQPDFEFLNFFKEMKIPIKLEQTTLKIETVKNFKGLEANLNSCPDLFPVLAVLCAFANSPSRLYGAPQLVHKESNRIAKVSELLTALGVSHEPTHEGMIINPEGLLSPDQTKPFSYNTDHDHRLAFAAALVLSKSYPIQINLPEVVNKSFPEFWQVVGLKP
ncbi:MAG: 3-phosphoshikimate 1-carboxyvinyltransferase, partial [Bdellovibrionales bacterium]|nr:3-phosphoshikimate 1-carboxyvinyltransferase [Bdellovibrionales bacterium]